MSSVGLSEWVLLALIGLIVLGPERLPRIASQIGSWIGQARRMTRVMKRQLEEEINFEKLNSIKPPEAAKTAVDLDTATEQPPANEHDDNYSPAHDIDSPGTGIADDEGTEAVEIDEKKQAPAEEDKKENKS